LVRFAGKVTEEFYSEFPQNHKIESQRNGRRDTERRHGLQQQVRSDEQQSECRRENEIPRPDERKPDSAIDKGHDRHDELGENEDQTTSGKAEGWHERQIENQIENCSHSSECEKNGRSAGDHHNVREEIVFERE